MEKTTNLFATSVRSFTGGLPTLLIIMLTVGALLGAGNCVWAGSWSDVFADNNFLSIGSTSATKSYTEVFTDNRPLSNGGQLNISNINGTIQAVGTDREEVSLVAEKQIEIWENASYPSCPSRDPQAILDSIRIEVGGDASQVTVETVFDEIGNDAQCVTRRVNYDAKLPRQAVVDLDNKNGTMLAAGIEGQLFLTSVNGDIHTDNVRGEQQITLTNGSIDIQHPSVLQSTERIVARATNGSITVGLPPASAFDYKAAVSIGNIDPDGFPLEVIRDFMAASAEGAVNGGGAVIDLEVTLGSITFTPVE